jgi:chromosome partitioning protein
MKTVAFFNNKGGVGKTTMVYHLAWMYGELGRKVLAVDLDPQSNLTSAFLRDDDLESLYVSDSRPATILSGVQRLMDSLGDIETPRGVPISNNILLIPGDLALGRFEDRAAEAWSACLDDNPSRHGDGLRVMTAFFRIVRAVADRETCDLALVDVGPSIGALNRAAMVAADAVVIPLGADLFSLQGLRNLGPVLRQWRSGWERRIQDKRQVVTPLPSGAMRPLGYVLLNPSVRENRPVKAYQKWADRIPGIYAREVLGQEVPIRPTGSDPNQLAMIKHFKSLMPMAQDARKPMFLLKPADGAIGGHAAAVDDCYRQFKALATTILEHVA